MKDYLLSILSTSPRGNRSLASQIGHCFVILLVILVVVSSLVSDAYTSVLKQDRSDALMTMASASALSSAHLPLQEGMEYPVSIPTYYLGSEIKPYTLNIYTKAGNSFLLVYSSATVADNDEQITLEGAGEAYQKVYNDQKVIVSTRSDKKGKFVAGVAPVISSQGTVSGLLEITMPYSDYTYTENGISLSWAFTIVSIAVAMCMVYFETTKLLQTVFGKPDRTLPKIIRYGLSGCQSVAFFSAMACAMPPIVISSFITASTSDLGNRIFPRIFVLLGYVLFAAGFFGFRSLRELFVRSLTTRVSLIASIFTAFILLVLSAIFSNFIVFLVLLLPVGFFLGMVLYFQREYRLYAGRLGYDDFSDRRILSTQYLGFILGASVGAVISGMLFERFGLLAVALVCGIILLIVGIQALLFVQHCPASPASGLTMPSMIYALSSAKSGTFLWSTIVTSGIQIAFFFLFIPQFIRSLRMSLATVSFYYILFFFIGSVFVRIVFMLIPGKIGMRARVVISACLQTAGFLLLAFMPSAKVLVISVVMFAFALSLHEFLRLDQYKEMLRPDKHPIARSIIETATAIGGITGAFFFGAVFLFDNVMIPLLVIAALYAVMLFSYPFSVLLFTPGHGKPGASKRQEPVQEPFLPVESSNPANMYSNVSSNLHEDDEDVKIYSGRAADGSQGYANMYSQERQAYYPPADEFSSESDDYRGGSYS